MSTIQHVIVDSLTTGDIDATIVPPGSLIDGRKVVATAGTREALASTTAVRSVCITAETDNTSYVVVGASTVVAALATRRGIPLLPGGSVTIDIDDLADIWLDVLVNGEGVTFLAEAA